MFPIAEWCQFERVQEDLGRTNNSIEGWHNRFSSALQCSHPSVFRLVQELQSEEARSRAEAEKLLRGAAPARRRPRWQIVSENIKKLVTRRVQGEITIPEFLRGIAHNFTL